MIDYRTAPLDEVALALECLRLRPTAAHRSIDSLLISLGPTEFPGLAERLQSDPAAIRLYEHLASSEAAIAQTMGDVAVPEGLAERLLMALEVAASLSEPSDTVPLVASAAPDAAGHDSASYDAAARVADAPLAAKRRVAMSRRWLLTSAATAASLALCGSLIYWWPSANAELLPETLLQTVLVRQSQELPVADAPLVTEQAPPRGFMPGANVALMPWARWHYVAQPLLGRQAALYELAPPGQASARLYVAPLTAQRGEPRLAMLPQEPLVRLLSTGGYAATTWTDNERVFVLVVAGNETHLRRWVRAAGSLA